MATFLQSQGVLTEEWSCGAGPGGLRQWTCRGICLDSAATILYLQQNQLCRVRFEEIPFRRELDVVSLDGTVPYVGQIDVRLGTLHSGNTAPARPVPNCVKLGPVQFANYAPMQSVGAYSGMALLAYSVTFQQIRM